jgi:hypothetical protein
MQTAHDRSTPTTSAFILVFTASYPTSTVRLRELAEDFVIVWFVSGSVTKAGSGSAIEVQTNIDKTRLE